jgi:hypothetical protein
LLSLAPFKSVLLYFELRGDLDPLKFNKRVYIKPGQSTKFRYYNTEYNLKEISVVKYYGSESGSTYNGIDNFLYEKQIERREKYPYLK